MSMTCIHNVLLTETCIQCDRDKSPKIYDDPISGLDPESLQVKYPEAYAFMCKFYCDRNYYNPDPNIRPADKVLMAIQYTLDHT